MTSVPHLAFLLVLAGIFGATLFGLLSRNVQAVVNGVASVLAASVPDVIELGIALGSGTDVAFGPELSLWIAVAGFLHMLGMLGWYETVWWWDHLTHTVSAALVAALVYASLHTHLLNAPGSQVTEAYAAVFTVLFTLGVGVVWELVELAARELGERIDRPPVLEYYGLRDTALDMAFNGVGAVAVVAFDVREFVSVAEQIPRITEAVVVGGPVLLFVSAVGIGIALRTLQQADPDTK
ncbi:MAG: hypothetical protein ACOCSN_04915 [Halanaeroarchaeum sp.]